MAASSIDTDVLRSYWEVIEAAAPASDRGIEHILKLAGEPGRSNAAETPGALCAPEAGGADAAAGSVDMFHFEQALAAAITGTGPIGAQEASTAQSVASLTATETVPSLTRLVVEEQKTLDHFHKLKFNWLELRTKQYFLEALLGCREGVQPHEVCPSDAEIAELEISSAQAKQALRKIKEQTRDLQGQMDALCAELAHAHGAYLESFDRCRTMVDDLCARVDERQNREQLDEHKLELASLAQEEAERMERVAKLQWEIRPLEATTETLRRDVAAAEERLASQESINEPGKKAARQHQVQHMAEWYRTMNQLLESISGIRIRCFGTDQLTVDLENVFTGTTSPVTVYFAPGSSLVARIVVPPASPLSSALDTPEREKIIRSANSTGDIGWLVRTLQSRLT